MKYDCKTGVFHSFLLCKLRDKLNDPYTNIMSRVIAKRIISDHGVPHVMHQQFFKEMAQFKLIRLKNKRNIELLK